jgi:hypothetical protein
MIVVQTRTQSLDLVGAIHRHLERRVRAALQSSSTRVRAVTIWLSDVNGPRGGADLHCAVSLDLIPRGSVRAEATDSDLLAAVSRALARARRSIHSGARQDRDNPRRSAPAVRVGGLAGPEPALPDARRGA